MSVGSLSDEARQSGSESEQSADASTFTPHDHQTPTDATLDETSGDAESTRSSKRQRTAEPSPAAEVSGAWVSIGMAEHNGQTYHTGDHAIFTDTENSSGTLGTKYPAVGLIHGIQRHEHSGSMRVEVSWYAEPRLTRHPPYMEFYKGAILRTFRMTVVGIECVREKCFVVQPADAMIGRPAEWTEGMKVFVCESRFVDKGEFIQKIKQWNKGFWPESMDAGRREMLTTMVPWPEGPRELEKSLLPVETADGANGQTPQSRRVTRMMAAPNSDIASPQTIGATTAAQQQQHMMMMQSPTPTTVQAQYQAYQQIMSQGQMGMPMNMNGSSMTQMQPPPFILNPQQQQQLSMQQIQRQQQMAGSSMMMSPGAVSSTGSLGSPPHTASPNVQHIQPPKRRGRPPKNKQLIEQRAKEDAAAIAAIAQGRAPPKPAPPVTRRHVSSASSQGNSGRPLTPSRVSALNGAANSSRAMPGQPMYTPAQLLGSRGQNGIASAQALQQQQLQVLQQQQMQHQLHLQRMQLLQQQQQKQQEEARRVAPLPHIDPATVPQLPKEVVDLFPTVGGKIRWFAAPPVCHNLAKAASHSDAYGLRSGFEAYFEAAARSHEQQQEYIHRIFSRSSSHSAAAAGWTSSGPGFGALFFQSLARAKAAVTKATPPPKYSRGAWSIINDVPYPPPPPYAGYTRHPPSYEEALEIGVVASPLRVEQRMRNRQALSRAARSIHLDSGSEPEDTTHLPRVASAPQLTMLASEAAANMAFVLSLPLSDEDDDLLPSLPEIEDAVHLPRYADVDDTLPLSAVVSRWRLGEPAFEKPARSPKGYAYPEADAATEGAESSTSSH
ncbi:hypothetical protein GGI15_003294 [Coemansia interrupta]|uniref:BAH domain-containing protein n=1 Tax=Coemansia interrupta TaxID=1126814 RepID=A0A9W8HGM3_9FUNG|nr:hypothetical protein GGI15_003294 [Coemansia interrupta]